MSHSVVTVIITLMMESLREIQVKFFSSCWRVETYQCLGVCVPLAPNKSLLNLSESNNKRDAVKGRKGQMSSARKETFIYKLLCAGHVYMHFLISVSPEPSAFVSDSTNKKTDIQEY